MQPATIAPGKKLLWDRRFIITNLSSRPMVVSPAGKRPLERDTILAGQPPKKALESIPIMHPEDETNAENQCVLPQGGAPGFESLAPSRFTRRVIRYPQIDLSDAERRILIEIAAGWRAHEKQ
jgi:hypothetical protein